MNLGARFVRIAGIVALACAAIAIAVCSFRRTEAPEGWAALGLPPVHGIDIVRTYPHDQDAFTQGLVYRNGFLYESTGLTGRSSLRKVRLETGAVVQQRKVDDLYFGEGLTEWNGRLVQLTPLRTSLTIPGAVASGRWSLFMAAVRRGMKANVGVTYDLPSFEPVSTFSYAKEGWGLTHDGRRLIMSDGSTRLRFLDPRTFAEIGRIEITDRGQPVAFLNELEFVNGEIYANVWLERRIAIINPDSGIVTGWIDLAGLESPGAIPDDPREAPVLNGIAYDEAGDRLFVTGKLWRRVYEIRLRAPQYDQRR